MICEEIVPGRQVTANGFARAGQVTMLGTVDSVMYPGTDQFQRFQYPSSLPPPSSPRSTRWRHGCCRIGVRSRHVQHRDAHRRGDGRARG
jgi:hypothetical protein